MDHLLKTKNEFRNLEKQEIQNTFTEMNNIAKNPKYDGYQRGLASMVYKLFDKKASGSGVGMISSAHANTMKKIF